MTRYVLTEGVATITLDRAEKLNALDEQAYDELREAFVRANAEAAAHVVVLRGEGRAFCAGGDIDMARTRLVDEHSGRTHFFGRMVPLSDAILALGKPVVFAVQGPCVGAGAELSLFADFVLADETAFFHFNGTAVGGCSWWGGPQLLPLLVGLRKAEELLYLSRPVPAEEAARIGLVNRVVPTGELDRATAELCEELLRISAEGQRLTKAGLRATKQLLLAGMAAAAEQNVSVFSSGELHEVFDAFRG